ncbi:hypothetical protein PTE30175_04975 [Pandoraea terrae]|uniref:Uncharacterized protein n=1 Tax=Pandoraea terrae TaxID=1537710 RepID=A0A5E4Z540_9BURK|nr:hypothetical protein PTE30175_04975 [Pandoraea terrae]
MAVPALSGAARLRPGACSVHAPVAAFILAEKGAHT